MSVTVDLELLASFAVNLEKIGEPDQDNFINWLGIKTDASLFPSNPNLAGQILKDLPTGGDGVYGSYQEYAAFLTAIREKGGDRDSSTAVELGAGWGPWVSSVGKVCQREGFSQINLVAVEAGQSRIDALHRHLLDNGLLADETVNVKIIEGAAWSHDGPLYFPVVGAVDHGGAASPSVGKTDYRGHEASFVEVDGVGLATICDGIELVDFMHWDVQGAELDIASASMDVLGSKVRYLYIGTHSRFIEGQLIELFYRKNWDILSATPCNFVYDRSVPSLTGMTTTDGELFLKNPRLA